MTRKTILITGSTGFLGRALVLNLKNDYNIIGLFHSESKYALFKRSYDLNNCKFYKSDLSDPTYFKMLLEEIFEDNKIDYIIHCAAMKHVDICEDNEIIALNTNIYSSKILASISKKYNLENMIAITTDKSIEPVNIYGYSKLIMQKIIQKYNYICYQGANFFWSDGSVLDIWLDQKKYNLPLTITSFEHTRYYNYIGHVSNLIKENLDKDSLILPNYVFKISNKILFEAFTKYFNYFDHKFINFDNEKKIELIDNNIKIIFNLDFDDTIQLIDIHYKNKNFEEYLTFEKELFEKYKNEL